jgi:ankyrin repeat protein
MPRHEVFAAIEQGDVERVRALADADPSAASARGDDGVSSVLKARYYGRADIVEILRAHRPDLDVFEAAAVGDLAAVRAHVRADPELVHAYAPDGFDALGLAAHFGHTDLVRFLLERGADPNRVARHAQLKVTALHAAAAGSHTDISRLLLDAGADVDAVQLGGFTPLHAAAQNGNEPLVRLLLERGADAAKRTADGKTAADLAEEHGHGRLVETLR